MNAQIEEELKRAKIESKSESKMLLLGAGESGKSTMLKQMRLMYRETYSEDERQSFRDVVYSNTLQSMQAVIKGFDAVSEQIPAELEATAAFISSLASDATDTLSKQLDPKIYEAIMTMWNHRMTKTIVSKSSAYQLNDSARYFFDELPRIGAAGYVPSDQDILRTRVRSTGIQEEKFDVNGTTLRVFDVGGQRSERRKWIHCFENVQVLVFVAAISEYDQLLWEDETVNRMDEATMLFESIAGSRWFDKSSFVLLLNKVDLFTEKLAVEPLEKHFPAYTGGDDIEQAKRFVRKMFTSLDKKRDRRPLYHHFTCATDTEQVRIVMAAVMDSVLTGVLQEVGLM